MNISSTTSHSRLTLFRTSNKGNKEWSSEEKKLEDYERVLDIYETIPNAGRPERVIQMLKSVMKNDSVD